MYLNLHHVNFFGVNVKSGTVTFGECKRVSSETTKERNWVLGGESVTELYEYKNLGARVI